MRTLPLFATALVLSATALPARALDVIGSNIVADVAERVTPSVVNITTQRTNRRIENMREHPLFREFFFGPPGSRPRRELGAGSGVVVSPDGLIVTNNHVIEGAEEIKVTFADGTEHRAKLMGTDKPADLALLKIDAKNLPAVPFGNSDVLRLGEFVLAIGNPFGVGQTVTMGIVSAKGRANIGIVDYEDFIQTDAAINPGNSGGALVNLKGELVGINTAILSRSGGAQGIGFAVPSSMVKPILEQIQKFGRVRRGWLGVAIQDLTPDLASTLELGETSGVLVSDVMDKGPAAAATLEAGDVIVSVNGQPTKNAAQLRNSIALMAPGSKASLKVLRGKKTLELAVKLGEKEAEALTETEREPDSILGGLSIADLDPEIRGRFRIPDRLDGVVVAEVEPSSLAGEAGLREGDVITHANRRAVRSVADLKKLALDKEPRILFRVWRGGNYLFVVLKR